MLVVGTWGVMFFMAGMAWFWIILLGLVVTLLINMFFGGRLKSMPPKLVSDCLLYTSRCV